MKKLDLTSYKKTQKGSSVSSGIKLMNRKNSKEIETLIMDQPEILELKNSMK